MGGTGVMAEWRNGWNGRMAEWRNGQMAGMAGIAGMKDGIMNVGMSERTAQWWNGRNGNQNIIKLLTMLKYQFPLWARVPVRVREHTLELRFSIDCGIVFCIGILDTPS